MCKSAATAHIGQGATEGGLSAVRDVLSEQQQEESVESFELESASRVCDMRRLVSKDLSTDPSAIQFPDVSPPGTSLTTPCKSPLRVHSRSSPHGTSVTTPLESAVTTPRALTPPHTPPPTNSSFGQVPDTQKPVRRPHLPILEESLRVVFDAETGPYSDIPKFLRPATVSLVSRISSPLALATNAEQSPCCGSFECVQEPSIPVQVYVALLFHSFKQPSQWATALALLRKFVRKSGVALTTMTVHRLLLTSLVVASRTTGQDCDFEVQWGVDESDLHAMETEFANGIGNDFTTTHANQVRELVPYHNTPQCAIMAAYLLSPDMQPMSTKRRVAKWVRSLPSTPPTQNKLQKAFDLILRKTSDIKSFIRPVHDDLTCICD